MKKTPHTVAQRPTAPEYDAETDGLYGDRRQEKPTLKDRLLSAASWAGGVAWLAPTATTLSVAHQIFSTETLQKPEELFVWGMIRSTGTRWKSWAHPAIRDDEQYLFAQNHVNHMDFVWLNNSVPHNIMGLELETHFKYPFYGWYMGGRGNIPVPAKREGRTDAIREGMRETFAKGRSVLVFPEGTRTLNGRVGPFRSGSFYIARDLGAKVVPVSVVGAYEMMRKGSLLIRPRVQVTVFCDEPVDFAGLSDEGVLEKMAEVRRAMCARVDAHYAEAERAERERSSGGGHG